MRLGTVRDEERCGREQIEVLVLGEQRARIDTARERIPTSRPAIGLIVLTLLFWVDVGVLFRFVSSGKRRLFLLLFIPPVHGMDGGLFG